MNLPALENFSDAALVLLGHGSTRNDGSAVPVFEHAKELRRRKIFGCVREVFWKQEPQVKTVLPGIISPRVFIVPMFISEGYFSEDVIPSALGFRLTEDPRSRLLRGGSQAVHYCRVIGTHESMTNALLSRAREVAEKFPFPRAPKNSETTLLVAGHGTGRNENSRKAIERQVELIRAKNEYAEVRAVFMEEEPRIAGCWETVATKNIVMVPFFISDGMHVCEDIPVLLGEPEQIVKARLAQRQPAWRNPTGRAGKLIWYSGSVGADPRVAEVILERVREAAQNF